MDGYCFVYFARCLHKHIRQKGGRLMRMSKAPVLFCAGALCYTAVEYLWRWHTGRLPVHWSMAVLGGAMFLLIGAINEFLPWEMPLLLQGLLGSVAVTAAELAAGLYLNLYLGLGIWDYSHLPFQLLGQICLPFSLAWVALSVVGVVLDDWLRHLFWGEEQPRYTFWGGGAKRISGS